MTFAGNVRQIGERDWLSVTPLSVRKETDVFGVFMPRVPEEQLRHADVVKANNVIELA